jgi:hypothetical protein
MKKAILFLMLICIDLLAFSASGDCTPDVNGNVTCNDFNANAALNIDLRIVNKHDAKVNKNLFSTKNDVTGVYVRNTNCWANDLDLTCVAAWHTINSSAGNNGTATLITPRHVIFAAHAHFYKDDSIRFVTKDNVTIRRKIIGWWVNTDFQVHYPDLCVGTLDSDVPSTITPCEILPLNFSQYLVDNGAGLPSLFVDQDKNAIVNEVKDCKYSHANDTHQFFCGENVNNANREALYEGVAMGDSGSPSFVVMNGKLVLIGVCRSYGPSGISLAHFGSLPDKGKSASLANTLLDRTSSLNDLIQASDELIGSNNRGSGITATGYKVKLFGFEGTSASKQTFTQKDRIFTSGKTLHVILADKVNASEMKIHDLFGRVIYNETISNLDKFELKVNGVYLVTLGNNQYRATYKVLVE